MTQAAGLPRHTVVEPALDRVLHAFAVPFAAGGVAWLFVAALPTGGVRQIVGLTIYGAGLIGSL